MNSAQPNTSQPDRFEALQAGRKFFIEHVSELLRDSRLISEAAVKAVAEGCGKHFDDMLAKRRQGSFEEEVKGLTSSRISLVGDDDLELDIRLDNLGHRLSEETAVPLWKSHLRFASLLNRPDLPKSDNPVGPRGVTEGLHALFRAAGASSLNEKLALLDRIELALLTGLPGVYSQLDAFLQQIGVEAATATVASTSPPPPSPGRPSAAASGATARPAPVAAAEAASSQEGAALLGHSALENLMFRLEQMENAQRNTADFLTATSPRLEALIPELFGDKENSPEPAPAIMRAEALGIPAATSEGRAIDQTGRFCDTLFKDAELPGVIKDMVAKLQIRLVKLAIRDRSLFLRTDHPCRQFIDRMGFYLLGLPATVSAAHPLGVKLTEVCEQLRNDHSGDPDAFAAAAGELDKLIGARRQEIIAQGSVYLPFLHQLDRREQADRDIAEFYARQKVDDLPEALKRFVLQDWKRLLERVWFEHGHGSQTWKEQTDTLNLLLWSFRPKEDGEQRRILGQKLPGILKSVKASMDELGLASDAQTQILDACFQLQTSALRPQPGEMPATAATAIPAANIAGLQRISIGHLEAGKRVLHTIDYSPPPAADSRKPAFPIGEWMEIQVDGTGQPLCLIHQSASSGRCLFFNPESGLALSIHPLILEEQLKKGNAKNLAHPGLFMRTLARTPSE